MNLRPLNLKLQIHWMNQFSKLSDWDTCLEFRQKCICLQSGWVLPAKLYFGKNTTLIHAKLKEKKLLTKLLQW